MASHFLVHLMRAFSVFCALSVALVAADNITQPESFFLSRPDIRAPILNVTINDASKVSPGFFFVAPYQGQTQAGPYIYDNLGNLVWTGYGSAGPATVHMPQVVSYNGSTYISYFAGNQLLGNGRGHGVLVDTTYRVNTTIQSGLGRTPIDLHEMAVVGGATVLVNIYQPVAADLSAYNVTTGQGWVFAGLVQEMDIKTGEVLFEWNSLDHVPLDAGLVAPNTTEVVGNGTTREAAWDYFHINSAEKTPDGYYLVSARHTNAIYKISPVDGSVVWTLGGKYTSFAQTNFNFSSQHDARHRESNTTTTILTLFDNASNGFTTTADYSTGMVISLNNETMTATLTNSYTAPGAGLRSASQGNMQTLENDNQVIGWGSNGFVSEHTSDGTAVWFASFAITGTVNYRAHKYNWTATPMDQPVLYTYAKTTSAPLALYVSWNGATEISTFRFHTSTTRDGEFTATDPVPKTGFETTFVIPTFAAFAFAEALDKEGTSLGNSSTVATFVPGPGLVASCGDRSCPLLTS
ncbi:MAG: hypothetical protein M1817_004469 [Caeruleum heppii]|nr:MAG: hypothetical protein M1817_004469 [Caeruleum heppii]